MENICTRKIREILISSSGVDEDSNLMGCDAVSIGKYLPVFGMDFLRPPSGFNI